MGHAAMVYLFDANGHLLEPIGFREDSAREIDMINRMLES